MLQPTLSSSASEKKLYALKDLPAHLRACLLRDRLFQLLTDLSFLEVKCNHLSIYEIEVDFRAAREIYEQNSPESKALISLERFAREYSHIIYKAPQIFFNLLSNYLDSEDDPAWSFALRAKIVHSNASHRNFLKKTKTLSYARVQSKHTQPRSSLGPVTALAITFDGRRVISGSENKRIIIWDLLNENPPLILSDSDFAIKTLKITPDDSKVLAGTDDGFVYVWNLNNGQLIRKLSGDRNSVNNIATTNDGERILTGHSNYGLVQAWDLVSGKLLGRHVGGNFLEPVDYVNGDLNIVIVHNLFDVFKEETRKFTVQDISTGKPVCEFNLGISDVTQTSDGSKLIVAGDGTISVIDSRNWIAIQSIDVKPLSISRIACLPDDIRIVVGTYEGELSIWDLNTGTQEMSILASLAKIQTMCVHPDGQRVFAGTSEGEILSWNYGEKQVTELVLADVEDAEETDKNEITSLITASKDSLIVAAMKNGCLPVWSLAEGKLIGSLRGHLLPVTAIARFIDSSYVITGSEDGSVRIWNVTDGELSFSIQTESHALLKALTDPEAFVGDPISAIAVGFHSKMLAYGTTGGWVYIHDFEKNQVHTIKPADPTIPVDVMKKITRLLDKESSRHPESNEGKETEQVSNNGDWTKEYHNAFSTHNVGKIQCLAIADDNNTIASTGDRDGSVKLWDLKGRRLLHSLKYAEENSLTPVYALTISSESQKAIFVSSGKSSEAGIIWEWDMERGNLVSSVELPGRLSSAIISDDKKYVISAFTNGILSITDLITKKTVPLYGGDSPVLHLTVSSDTSWIFCGYKDGRLDVFKLNNLNTTT